jgi:RNA-directed DNA polymerase
MLAALAKGAGGSKWFSLIDKVWRMDTLGLAWETVRANAGACGVDRISVGRFAKDSQKRLLAVNERLREGSYRPQPVRRVRIPKPGSKETRPLGVPAVVDRVVQTALKTVIEPVFESAFEPHSYGYRPGRSAKDALRRVGDLLDAGHLHVVDVDIRKYFDTIPHDKLMELVGRRIADGRVLGLVRAFLEAGVIEGGEFSGSTEGTPQGGTLSSLLANLYLDPLDKLAGALGLQMTRYADDIVVLCRSEEQAQGALAAIRQWALEAGLELHPEKTRTTDMGRPGSHFDFLGYRFKRVGSGKLLRLVRPASLKGLRDRVRRRTPRKAPGSIGEVIARINPVLRGWYSYFKHAHWTELAAVDQWVRMRLRSILRKRSKRRGRGRGADHYRWPNCYFTSHGLYVLADARAGETASLHHGANR